MQFTLKTVIFAAVSLIFVNSANAGLLCSGKTASGKSIVFEQKYSSYMKMVRDSYPWAHLKIDDREIDYPKVHDHWDGHFTGTISFKDEKSELKVVYNGNFSRFINVKLNLQVNPDIAETAFFESCSYN